MALDTLEGSPAFQLRRLRATYRKRGWTIWHGNSTNQYWAAHTGQMVLLSGESPQALIAEIERIQPSNHPTQAPTRRYSPWRRLSRSRSLR